MKKKLKYLGISCMFAIMIIIVISFIQTFFFKNEYPFVYKPALILSGSMEPEFSKDDLVIVKKIDKLSVGDIVLYTDNDGKKIMHRIKAIEGDSIITRGDANNVDDSPINYKDISGIYVGKIAYVGKIIKFIKTPIGLVTIVGIMLLIYFIPNKKDDKKEEKKEENKIERIVIEGSVYIVLITICILAGYYSRYISQVSGETVGTVARWDNDLTITTSNEVIFKNNDNNSLTIPIHITSSSEVSSKYFVIVENLIEEYNVTLSNDEYSLEYSLSENILNINYKGESIVFDMNNSRETFGNYSMNKTVINNTTYISIRDLINNKEIFEMTKDSYNRINVSYKNLGEFLIGSSMTNDFSLKITTYSKELPSNTEINISALFEQID